MIDLENIRRTWLVPCGSCDYGLNEFGCTCPPGDIRSVVQTLVDELAKLRRELEQTKAQRNLAADWLESSAEVERERDAARAELAKTRAELDEARIAAGVNWDASSHHHHEWVRAEHELEQITGVAKALRITVAEMLSGKQHTQARAMMWESTLKYATEALANPATTAEPAATLHGYTPHGHPCCEQCPVGDGKQAVARCGGTSMCVKCQGARDTIHETGGLR